MKIGDRHLGTDTCLSSILIAMTLLMITSAHADITTGLVGYWAFDDSTASDSSGKNNHLQLINSPSLVDGKVGKAFNFSKTNDYLGSVVDMPSLNLPGDFTVAAWINMTTFGANGSGRIVNKSVSNGGYDFWATSSTKALGFQTAGGNTYYSNPNVINTGAWYHVVFTRKGSSGAFYINGTIQGTPTVTLANNSQAVPFQIGIGGYHFNGQIDDVRVYTRALTQNEINQICNCQKDIFPPALSLVQSVNITSKTASITWSSDEPADSQVEYGTSTSYGNSTTLDSTLIPSPSLHSVVLNGLFPSTIYHYRIISKDAAGNTATSGDNTFTTATASGSTAVTQSMFYNKTAGPYVGSGGYKQHYRIAEPFEGYYLNAANLKGNDPSAVVTDNTYYGDEGGVQTLFPANETAIKLSATKANTISLDFQNLQKGVYFIRIIGRVNQPSVPRIVKPLILNFSINDGPHGEVHQYRMKVLYANNLEETGRIFFNALNPINNLHGELSVDASSQEDLLVHRIDFFDALIGVPIQKIKTAATTYTADEQSYMRSNPGVLKTLPVIPHGLTAQQRKDRDDVIWNAFPPINSMHTGDGNTAAYNDPAKNPLWPGPVDGKGKATTITNAEMISQYGTWSLDVDTRSPLAWNMNNYFDMPWKLVNSILKDADGKFLTYTMDDYINHRPLPDPYPCKDAGFGCYFTDSNTKVSTYHFVVAPLIFYRMEIQYSGAIYGQGSDSGADVPYRYYVNGDPDTARDASLALVRFALQWPALQMDSQGVGYNSSTPDMDFGGNYHWAGSRQGKIYYNGWTGVLQDGYAKAYDYLYEYMKNNQEFANAVHRYVPWVNTPDDVIALMDTYLLQTIYNDSLSGRVDLSNPLLLGLVMQNGPLAQKLMDISKVNVDINPLGSTTMKRHYRTSIGQDGSTLIGSLNYTMGESTLFLNGADPIARYKANTSNSVPFDLTDLIKFPKIREYANTFSNILVAGGYMSPFGDSGNGIDTARHLSGAYVPIPRLKEMWKSGGQNPRVAWFLVNVAKRSDQNDAQWAAIQAAATTRDPRLSSDSRVFNGLGLGILESAVASNNYQDKSAVVIRTGTGQGHAHFDALSLSWYGLGLRMGTPYGTRNDGTSTFSVPADNASYTHNTVEVDGYVHPLKAKNGWPAGSFTSAEAWFDSFAPGTGVQYISAAGSSANHSNVSVFRRDDALIDIDDSHSYVFDVFRVGGGQLHTWCFHGADTDNESGGMTINTAMSSNLDSDAANYLRKFADGTKNQGTAADKLEVTWRLGRTASITDLTNGDGTALTVKTIASEQSMLGSDYNASAPRKYTKVSLFDRTNDKVLTGNEYSAYYQINTPNILVQSGTGGTFDPNGNKQDVYPAIIEAYAGSSMITASSSLPIVPNESDALKAVALSATMTNGNNDIMFSDGRNITRTINGSMKVNARSAYFSTKNGDFRMMNIVGGMELTNGSYSLRPTIGIASSTIKSVDYPNQKIYTTTKIPTSLINRDFRIFNVNHHTAYTVTAIADSGLGSVLTFAKPSDIGEISVDSISGTTLTSAQDWNLSYIPNRNKGFTATNESSLVAFKIGKASRNPGETNNIISNSSLGQPVSRSDFNDDDGDGVAQAIIYDFGFGDTIEVDSSVSLKSTGTNTYSMMTGVDTTLTVPGNGDIQVSADQSHWTSLSTTSKNGVVTAIVPANSAVQYIQVLANLTPPPPPINLGDVSGDGKVTMYDAALMLRYTLGSPLSSAQKKAADINADGKIDGADVVAIARKALGL